MADERSNEALHPTKEVRITGERSATLVCGFHGHLATHSMSI
ncbi:hypothetical protein [Pseudomonas aeruginosa]|nr:hypothetical protein [Pseudomonas aeruginosa]WME44329.1 hypothetical protein RBH02_30010 [Pseudomonas aeruginosa]